MGNRKWQVWLSIMLLVLFCAAAPAQAQPFPNRLVRLIVPYPAGGGVDAVARLLAVGLGKQIGQNVLVENRPGASGAIGTVFVKTSPPDGYTMLFAPVGQVITQFLSPVSYDLLKDFSPITLVCQSPMVLAVHQSVPANDLQSLIDYSRKSGKQISWGIGSAIDHVGAELFNQRTGLTGLIVPYKGGGPATMAVVSGEVNAAILPPVLMTPHVKSGKLKAIAVTSLEESPAMPGVPAVAHLGLPGYEINTWFGIWGPKGMPEALVRQIQGAIATSAKDADYAARLLDMGFVNVASTPDAFSAYVAQEAGKYQKVIKERGIKGE